MKKIMSIAVVALFVAGVMAFAQDSTSSQTNACPMMKSTCPMATTCGASSTNGCYKAGTNGCTKACTNACPKKVKSCPKCSDASACPYMSKKDDTEKEDQ